MGELGAFLKIHRVGFDKRDPRRRVDDYDQYFSLQPESELRRQGARCMDCGVPFCHEGCPLGNLIPDWNDLVYRGKWRDAIEQLHATNNFPEFTGLICPAPCESSCVLKINDDPVTIEQIELAIVERAYSEGWITASPPVRRTGRTVAVIGSGPAGLAAAQQLTRAGHAVTVFERDEAPGGLLRYGIPEFKMEKRHLDRRLAQMTAEGTQFRCSTNVGTDITAAELRAEFDAIMLAGGATVARGLPMPGADADGIHQAMEYLTPSNRAVNEAAASGGPVAQPAISARGQHVVIIGGGDTGADCLGTAHRQGAASVTQLEIMPRPPELRPDHQPWPTYPMTFRTSGAHEEGGERVYAVSTQEFVTDQAGHVRALRLVEVEFSGGRFEPVPGSERDLPADLVLLAMGFTGAERGPLMTDLGVEFDDRGNVARDGSYATSVPGVFVAGDMGRGQSLIVWAIAEGRSAAAGLDRYLSGDTVLPVAIPPTARPMV